MPSVRAHEALRDLVRARTAAKTDERRARQRLLKLLLRHGVRPPDKVKAWTVRHRAWLKQVTFEEVPLTATFVDYLHEIDHQGERIKRLETAIDEAIETAPEEIKAVVEGLQALRGVAKTTAVGVVVEIGKFSRFEHPRLLMGFCGSVPREYSTGGPGKHRRGRITKCGNTHLRRMVTESAWSYRHKPGLYPALQKRQQGVSDEICEISWNAQVRLSGKYRRLLASGKEKNKAITAVGRELLGFIWAIAIEVESKHQTQAKAA